MDVRLAWFAALTNAVSAKSDCPISAIADKNSTEALLLDPRLMWTKGVRIDSFVAGTVATFLQKDFLSDCEVLRDVCEETLEQLRVLLKTALPDFTARAAAATLLFRSTRDGASATAFHSHCDAKGPTLVLIKDTDDNVFGGYTQKNWSSIIWWECVSDPAAFLISVVSPQHTRH
jgi:hypothetical protein